MRASILLFVPFAAASHDNLVSMEYGFNGEVGATYHSLHLNADSDFGWFLGGLYASTHKNIVNTDYIDSLVTDNHTETITTVTTTRQVKCNPNGKCHEYGKPIETTTTETYTYDNSYFVTDEITTEKHKRETTYLITGGISYTWTDSIYPYVGLDLATVDGDFEQGINVGVIYNKKDIGLTLGYHSITDSLMLGVNFEW